MKNIHILPTDKASRLGQVHEKLSFFKNRAWDNTENWRCKNIYITSDEEIKVRDWFYLDDAIIIAKYISVKPVKEAKKIILTTDPDLIKDGVQAIPDEFLEWFVKNPSCKGVNVEKQMLCENCGQEDCDRLQCRGHIDKLIYKIIIPQEEPKSSCPKCRTTDFDNCHSMECPMRKEEPKQETTLEEAAETQWGNVHRTGVLGFIEGAKWQAERMYSEEEVYDILFKHTEYFLSSGERMSLKEWFEQFKKK